ncbi:MAG: TonB-dependent receptor [Pseudomonadota bacterium]
MTDRNRLFGDAAALALVASLTAAGAANAAAIDDINVDEIIITSSPLEQPLVETIGGLSVLSGEELARRIENTIGETLRREPGISSTFFGPGASRPIIRGLGGDRIRVLDNGIGSIDASPTSPDHAVAIDPITAEKVEVVRGTAMLLYGSSAAGGIVNIVNDKIARERPEDGLDGALRIGGSTVDNGVDAAGAFNVELFGNDNGALVFHGDGYFREADDYDIPGFAESERFRAAEEAEEAAAGPGAEEDEEEEAFGTLPNSAFETKGGSAGLSWVFGNGFIGISGTALDTVYGVPGGKKEEEEGEEGEEGEEEGEEEGGVTIDLRQRRLDLDSELEGDLGLFSKIKFRLGYADYEHTEFEGNGEAGTVFSNEGWEGRLELVGKTKQMLGGEVTGAAGLQFRLSDFAAIGEEAFVPPTDTTQLGVFGIKEYTNGPWRIEVGGRYENTEHEVVETGLTRDFDAFSFSGGVGLKPAEGWFVGVTGFRTERAPSPTELFSNGPHLATRAFEIGDPELDEEVALGAEATIRYASDRIYVAVNGFYTSYDGFIFEAATGEIEDGLDVFEFRAEDADFRGFEAEAEAELFSFGAIDIHADTQIDYVRATTDVAGNDNLPRIPPLSGLVGLEARFENAELRGEFEYATRQDEVADFELVTDGYQVANVYFTVRPFSNAQGLAIRIAGTNLTNEEVRLHPSFLKDFAPLPGRNVRFSIRGDF